MPPFSKHCSRCSCCPPVVKKKERIHIPTSELCSSSVPAWVFRLWAVLGERRHEHLCSVATTEWDMLFTGPGHLLSDTGPNGCPVPPARVIMGLLYAQPQRVTRYFSSCYSRESGSRLPWPPVVPPRNRAGCTPRSAPSGGARGLRAAAMAMHRDASRSAMSAMTSATSTRTTRRRRGSTATSRAAKEQALDLLYKVLFPQVHAQYGSLPSSWLQSTTTSRQSTTVHAAS